MKMLGSAEVKYWFVVTTIVICFFLDLNYSLWLLTTLKKTADFYAYGASLQTGSNSILQCGMVKKIMNTELPISL